MGISVKGTILTDLVKIVRKERQLPWDDYLEPEDWDIINGEILATQWYPGVFFLPAVLRRIQGGGTVRPWRLF